MRARRGILIDSARHFLNVPTLLKLLDSMAYAKFNVMHWHLSDAQVSDVLYTKLCFMVGLSICDSGRTLRSCNYAECTFPVESAPAPLEGRILVVVRVHTA